MRAGALFRALAVLELKICQKSRGRIFRNAKQAGARRSATSCMSRAAIIGPVPNAIHLSAKSGVLNCDRRVRMRFPGSANRLSEWHSTCPVFPLMQVSCRELRWVTCGGLNVGTYTDSEINQSIKRLLKSGWLTGAAGEKVEEKTILSPTQLLASWLDR